MTQEALKLAVQLRDTASGYWTENEIPIIEKLIELLAQPEQEPFGYFKAEPFGWTDCAETDEGAVALYTTPPQRKPLTDVIQAAQSVLEWIEIQHRPPVRDVLEGGRMVRVRLHALADLHDALAAHNIKENT